MCLSKEVHWELAENLSVMPIALRVKTRIPYVASGGDHSDPFLVPGGSYAPVYHRAFAQTALTAGTASPLPCPCPLLTLQTSAGTSHSGTPSLASVNYFSPHPLSALLPRAQEDTSDPTDTLQGVIPTAGVGLCLFTRSFLNVPLWARLELTPCFCPVSLGDRGPGASPHAPQFLLL